MNKRRVLQKVNIPMLMAAVLFYCTILSIHMTSSLYARYASYDSGEDSARVVSFSEISITETGDFYDENKLMIIPGVDIQKKATVEFSPSESEVYVFVEVILSDKWETTDHRTFSIGSAMHWAVDDSWTYLPGSSHVYYQSLSPLESLENADIVDNNGMITVSDRITKWDIGEFTGTFIHFRASVIQSTGFESPAEAWAAISKK